MNFREIFGISMIALSFMMLTRVVTNWFVGPEDTTRFIAPVNAVEQKPLNVEVDFTEGPQAKSYVVESLTTSYGRLNFSTAGGTLSDFTFVRTMDGRLQEFSVLNASERVDREQTPFLIALDTETPYEYTHVGTTEAEDLYTVQYRASCSAGTIDKIFTVYKNKTQIDLALTIKPKREITPRLVWSAPTFKMVEHECAISSVVFDKRGSFTSVADTKLNFKEGYLRPRIFGAQDKYFLCALVGDVDGFAQRAYYKSVDANLLSFIEAAPVHETTTWNMSFYCGPKEFKAIQAVDPTLEKVLNYGMFSFLTKPLLALLSWLNTYLNNFGLSIIILTVLMNLVLLPFSWRGDKKMRKLQDYSQKMDYLKRKYKDDPEGLKQAQMDMLKEKGLPLSGCLMPFIQLPFFFALSGGLNNSLELYKAPFLWIKDLSLSDPYYILPFFVTITMLFGGIMQVQGGAKQRMGGIAMGLIFGAVTSVWASGTVLYIAINMMFHTSRAYMMKLLKV